LRAVEWSCPQWIDAGASRIVVILRATVDRDASTMPYTLWSRGRLLGETELGFVQISATHRMGWFHPSPLGSILMPVLTGTGPALKAVGKLMSDPVRTATRSREQEPDAEWPPDIRTTTEYADLVSSVDELESMQLQMRDPAGVVMTTRHIGIDDTVFKLSFLSKRERRRWKKLSTPEPWEPPEQPFPRYQIQVFLTDSDCSGSDDVPETV
jgi:hypothetical protein